jgi:hypothetical protein
MVARGLVGRDLWVGRSSISAFVGALGRFAALCALDCGTGEHVDVPETSSVDASTGISSGVNLCPYFQGSLILPQQLRPRESASITVRATDPDAADSQLVFSWSAASGTFSADDKPVTNYECSKLGTLPLTVTATDRQGCSIGLTLSVDCIPN